MLTHIEGNIFDSKSEVLVCPVNTVGVMGAGLAKEFKDKYPKQFTAYYQELCMKDKLHLGDFFMVSKRILLFPPDYMKDVLLFPTKGHWSEQSNYGTIMRGLELFVKVYGSGRFYDSFAFPLLGAGLGGLDPKAMMAIMDHILLQCAPHMVIEIWTHKESVKPKTINTYFG